MGKLPPLVLISGIMCNEQMWVHQKRYFSEKTAWFIFGVFWVAKGEFYPTVV